MDRHEYEREIIVRLFHLSNKLQTYIDKLLKQDKLTTKQFFMMIIMGSFGYEPKLGEISERFGTSRQNAKQVLLKLQKQEFIELYKDENDSRVLRARFTNRALAFWEERDEIDNNIMNTIFSDLSTSELEIYRNVLVKTINKVNNISEG